MSEEEFKDIVLPMHRAMYAHCMLLLKDRDEASDCVQDSMTKLWEMRGRLSEIERKDAYCIVTARRFALDRLRKRKAIGIDELDAETESDYADGEHALSAKNDLERLERMLGMLPEGQRVVVTLSGIEGMSNKEIADETGLSKENVRVLLSRGRSRLREWFSKIK